MAAMPNSQLYVYEERQYLRGMSGTETEYRNCDFKR